MHLFHGFIDAFIFIYFTVKQYMPEKITHQSRLCRPPATSYQSWSWFEHC